MVKLICSGVNAITFWITLAASKANEESILPWLIGLGFLPSSSYRKDSFSIKQTKCKSTSSAASGADVCPWTAADWCTSAKEVLFSKAAARSLEFNGRRDVIVFENTPFPLSFSFRELAREWINPIVPQAFPIVCWVKNRSSATYL